MAGSTLRLGDSNAQYRTLTRYLIHPKYDKLTNDISILYWEKHLIFGSTVQAIRLPIQDFPVPYGENATVSGFGRLWQGGERPTVLQSVQTPLVSPPDCTQAYAKSIKITDDMVCAGGLAADSGTCQGDSGGALVSKGVIVGIVSRAIGCGALNYPTVYARVPFFTNWIEENMH